MISVENDKFKIKIIGIGEGGIRAIANFDENSFKQMTLLDTECLEMDTNCPFLNQKKQFIKIGINLTKGCGTGALVEIGEKAAEEDKKTITEKIKDCNLLIIVAGLGGGSGSGASPVVVEIAKKLKIPTIAFVTKPFDFEGKYRNNNAKYGLEKLKNIVDVLLVLSNEKFLADNLDNQTKPIELFKEIDEILQKNILKVVDLLNSNISKNISMYDILKLIDNEKSSFIEIFKAS